MNAVFSFKDNDLGTIHLILPKIREITKTFGSVVVTFDNGDKRNIESSNPDETIHVLIDAINDYYKK